MAAARNTLGSGRARITKPATAIAPRIHWPRRRTPAARPINRSVTSTIVRLVPETASRWVNPPRRKSSCTNWLSSLSSPWTSAGMSALGSWPVRLTASVTAALIRDEAAHHQASWRAGPTPERFELGGGVARVPRGEAADHREALADPQLCGRTLGEDGDRRPLGLELAALGSRRVDRLDCAALERRGQLGESPPGDVGARLLIDPHSPKLGRRAPRNEVDDAGC